MEYKKSRILVIGSDSMIGRELISYLTNAGEDVIGTTRRKEKVSEKNLFLDLSQNSKGWPSPESVKVAIICAGITKVAECQRDPKRTKRINTDGIIRLIRSLVIDKTFIIYLSTSQVFDGSKPFRKPDDPLSPITEYGRQRAEVEAQIGQWKESVAIIRSTKIFDKQVPLFQEWVRKMRLGKVIHPFSDMTVAPIPIETMISLLRIIIEKQTTGVYQISGNRDIFYHEAAYMGAELLNLDKKLIQPVLSSQSIEYTENVVKFTSLKTDKIRDTFGIEPPNVEWTIKRAFDHINCE